MKQIVKKMIGDLDYVIEQAKKVVEANNADTTNSTSTMLEAIRNATFTKASVIQAMDKLENNLDFSSLEEE